MLVCKHFLNFKGSDVNCYFSELRNKLGNPITVTVFPKSANLPKKVNGV